MLKHSFITSSAVVSMLTANLCIHLYFIKTNSLKREFPCQEACPISRHLSLPSHSLFKIPPNVFSLSTHFSLTKVKLVSVCECTCTCECHHQGLNPKTQMCFSTESHPQPWFFNQLSGIGYKYWEMRPRMGLVKCMHGPMRLACMVQPSTLFLKEYWAGSTLN